MKLAQRTTAILTDSHFLIPVVVFIIGVATLIVVH